MKLPGFNSYNDGGRRCDAVVVAIAETGGARVQIPKLVGSDIMVEKRDDELISGYRGTSSPSSVRGSHGFCVGFEAKGARERAFIRKSCS